MASSKLKLTLLSALVLGGCSQILGISDYDIDPKLGNVGGDDGGGGEDGGGTTSAGGSKSGDGGGGNVVAGSGGDDGNAGSMSGGAGGEGAAPALGPLIPCSSEDCCDDADGISLGLELLSDPGFELGPVGAGSPWTQESDKGVKAITDNLKLGWEPKSGDFYVYLAGIPGERTSLYSEDFEVPSDAGWFVVSGYRWFQIDAEDTTNTDFALVGFFSYESETAEELPFQWESGSADGYGDSPTWVRFETSFDATPYQGMTTYIGLRGESDMYPADPNPDDEELGPASSYLFDDVSFQAFACYERP